MVEAIHELPLPIDPKVFSAIDIFKKLKRYKTSFFVSFFTNPLSRGTVFYE
jgi:hypothetical protein